MQEIRRILVVGSNLSGSTSSLLRAFRAEGCEATHAPLNLKVLPFRAGYVMAMIVEALVTYGRRFPKLRRHTRAGNAAVRKAIAAIVRAHPGTDLVIQMGRHCAAPAGEKLAGVAYALMTDHTNMLSKRLPDFGVDFPERHTSRRWNEIERRTYNGQDHVFVMGQHVRQSMIDDYGVPPSSVTAVGAGPNLDVDIERDRSAKDYSGKNILFVGLDANRKGLPTLRKAFDAVRRVHGDARLNVVGVEGPNGDGITYHGRLYGDALKQLFYDSQIFALPSVREPFGFVFLEAMWSKTVCIGCNIEAMPEIIQDGESGYVVEPNDDQMLAERLISLLNSPDNLRRMAENAYAAARSRWGWSRVARTILDTTRDLRRQAPA
jgi:glycosyltransferase involved in cell wall biosynthesis